MRPRITVADDQLAELASFVAQHEGLVLVVAPPGYGKSALLATLQRQEPGVEALGAEELRALALRSGTAGVRPGATVKPGPGGEPALTSDAAIVVIDDWEAGVDVDEAAAVLAGTAVRTLVIAARRLPPVSRSYLLVGTRELAMGLDRTVELATARLGPELGERIAASLAPASDGWPAAVTALLDRIGATDDPVRSVIDIVNDDAVLDRIIPGWADAVGDEALLDLAALAHLESFSDSLVADLGMEASIARAVDAGIPMLPVTDRWLCFVEPARRSLAAAGPLPRPVAESAAAAFVADHRPVPALRALIAAGAEDAACALVEDLAVADLDDSNQQELIAVLRRLIDTSDRGRPRLGLRLARALRNAGQIGEEHRVISELGRSATESGVTSDPEIRAEILYHRAVAGAGSGLADELSDDDPDLLGASPATRIRLREARAVASAQQDADWRTVEGACGPLEQVAEEWLELGDTVRATGALRVLAAAPLYHLGDYRAGQRALHRAVSLCGPRTADRAVTTELLCRFSVLAGDLPSFDTEIGAALRMADERSFPWMKAYLHWSQMHAAARRRHPADLEAHWHAALVQLRELREHPTGVVFCAESASLFAEIGDHERAAEMLAAAQVNRSHNELEVAIAEVVTAARRGDVDMALASAAELGRSPIMPPTRHWRLLAEESVVRSLVGDHEESARLAERVIAQARLLELEALAESLLTVRDPDASVSKPTPRRDAADHVSIRTLGDFRVEVAGIAVTLPAGRVETLAKLLALAGHRPVAEDIVIEELWPGEDPEIGLRRLKNVLSRLRGVIGTAAVVRSRGGLALGADVGCDVSRFRELAGLALDPNRSPAERLAAAVDGLALAEGELLPTDLYSDWIEEHRRHVRTLTAGVFQYLLGREPQSGPDPAWMLTVASRHFSDDDQTLLALSRRALADGEGHCARQALEMAVRAADALGVSLTQEVAELGPQVGVPAAT